MNSENPKTSDPHRLLLNVLGEINLKRKDKYVALLNLSIYYIWEKIKESYKSNKFKKSASASDEEFELPDRSYSVSDIQNYFKYITKTHETVTDNPWIMIYVNKMENRIKFNIKARYYLELLFLKIMKLLGSTKSKITKNKMVKIFLI